MRYITRSKISFVNLLMLLVAGIINAFGVTLFLAPINLYDSGFSGTSMLLANITPYSLSFFLIFLNIPFFLYGYKRQGRVFTVYSIFAVVIYSLGAYIFPRLLHVTDASPFAGQDILLCAIFGGLISGVGSGLTIRFGGAIDGVEVMAVIFAKRLSLTVGTFVMIYNTVLYLAAGISLNSYILPLYSILAYCAAIKAVDFIVEGFDKAKSAMIITAKVSEVSEGLSEAFGSGITLIDAKGYFEGKQRTVIYFVVNRFQIAKMKDIIRRIDPQAFVTISEVTDIMRNNIKAMALEDKINAGLRKKSFSLPYNNGMIWCEHLDSLVDRKDAVIKKFDQDVLRLQRPSESSLVIVNLDETFVDEELLSHIIDAFVNMPKQLRKIAFIGLTGKQRLHIAYQNRNVPFEMKCIDDFEEAKEWLFSI